MIDAPYALHKVPLQPTRLLFNGSDLGPVADHYFDPPMERDVVGTVLNQMRPGQWRTPFFEVSQSSEPDGPRVYDELTGRDRAVHDRLVSNTFHFHQEFGLGHVMRTDGSLAAFWDGVVCQVVRLENLVVVRVVLGRDVVTKRESRKEKLKALLDSI